MSLHKLLPNASKQKVKKNTDSLFYVAMVEWKWSWDDFLQCPIPVFLVLIDQYTELKQKEARAAKKKR